MLLDANATPMAVGSNPEPANAGLGRFTTLGQEHYFVAFTAAAGEELYRTVGAPGSTTMVKDIAPGSASSDVRELVAFANRLFFAANDGVNGSELWTFDPLTGQAVLLVDINRFAGGAGSDPGSFAPFRGKLYFRADDGLSGAELWVTDGTAAGTNMVFDLNPVGDGDPSEFVEFNNALYFAADGPAGRELWRTDGTSAGTVLVADINPLGDSSPSELTVFNNELYFVADDGATGRELWRTNGIAAPARFADLQPGIGSSFASSLTVYRSELWFAALGSHPASSAPLGFELWRTDGTTLTPMDLVPGPGGSSPRELTVAGSGSTEKLAFCCQGIDPATGQDPGRELWVHDGTGFSVLETNPGAVGGEPTALVVDGIGRLFFTAKGPATGREPHISDFTKAGTRIVKDVYSLGPHVGSHPRYLTALPGAGIILAADDGIAGLELWASDGTASGTQLIADIHGAGGATLSSEPELFTDAYGRALFFANRQELYATDGTTAGTTRLFDISPRGFWLPRPSELTLLGQKLFYVADSDDPAGGAFPYIGRELFVYDLVTGQRLGFDLNPGTSGSDPDSLVVHAGRLFFRANTAAHGTELWVSDGTMAGTKLVKDIRTGPGHSIPYDLTVFAGKLWFAANDGTHGSELWCSDGTAAGTILFQDLYGGAVGSAPMYLTVHGDTLVFKAGSQSTGEELWLLPAGATRATVVDIEPGPESSYPNPGFIVRGGLFPGVRFSEQSFATNAGRLWFSARTSTTGVELFVTDATPAGTRLVADIGFPDDGMPLEITAFGNGVVFQADDGLNGTEPWFSDGTAAGTAMVRDLSPAGGSDPKGFVAVGSRRFAFAARATGAAGADLGVELFVSDGTTAGTVLVDDLQPGPGGSEPMHLAVFEGRLLFSADDGTKGREPYALDLGAVAYPHGYGCAARRLPPRLTGSDPILGASTVLALDAAPPSSGALLVFGVRTRNVLAFPAGCAIYPKLAGPTVLLSAVTTAGGSLQITLPVPASSGLIGLSLVAQAAVGPTSTPPFGVDISNGLVLVIGQ